MLAFHKESTMRTILIASSLLALAGCATPGSDGFDIGSAYMRGSRMTGQPSLYQPSQSSLQAQQGIRNELARQDRASQNQALERAIRGY
jgi:hypothetical protein